MQNGLSYVYTGNVHDEQGGSTYCPSCGEVVIGRDWYVLKKWAIDDHGACIHCGTKIAGRFEPMPGTWARNGSRFGSRTFEFESRRTMSRPEFGVAVLA